MSGPEFIDGEVVDVDADVLAAQPASASVALARRERRSEVIRPLNAEQLVESFGEYQALLPKLLDAGDWQDAGRGERFVKKSGWRKIATAFDLDVQLVRSVVERDMDGRPTRAEVWARAIAPSGRAMDGDGYCSVDEERFSSPRGRAKLENDLRATATTRAMNRAISGLVGMGAVSAEEVDGGRGQAQPGPPHGPVLDAAGAAQASNALLTLVGDHAQAEACWAAITNALGYMPDAVGRALYLAARAQTRVREAAAAPGEPAGEEAAA